MSSAKARVGALQAVSGNAGNEQVKKLMDTKKLEGSVPFVHAQTMKIMGDGNCLFLAISYAISNSEQYHAHVRREICNFIETYDKGLKPLMKKGQGKTFIEGSGMRQLGTW